MNFQQLVRQKIAEHPFNPICIKEKAKKERKRKTSAARYQRIKDNPEFKQHKKEYQKEYRQTPEYKKHHAEEMRIWRAKQTPEWKEKEIQRVRQYNPKHKETKVYHGIPVTNIKLTKEIKK